MNSKKQVYMAILVVLWGSLSFCMEPFHVIEEYEPGVSYEKAITQKYVAEGKKPFLATLTVNMGTELLPYIIENEKDMKVAIEKIQAFAIRNPELNASADYAKNVTDILMKKHNLLTKYTQQNEEVAFALAMQLDTPGAKEYLKYLAVNTEADQHHLGRLLLTALNKATDPAYQSIAEILIARGASVTEFEKGTGYLPLLKVSVPENRNIGLAELIISKGGGSKKLLGQDKQLKEVYDLWEGYLGTLNTLPKGSELYTHVEGILDDIRADRYARTKLIATVPK